MVAEKILPKEVAMPFVDGVADDAATSFLPSFSPQTRSWSADRSKRT